MQGTNYKSIVWWGSLLARVVGGEFSDLKTPVGALMRGFTSFEVQKREIIGFVLTDSSTSFYGSKLSFLPQASRATLLPSH